MKKITVTKIGITFLMLLAINFAKAQAPIIWDLGSYSYHRDAVGSPDVITTNTQIWRGQCGFIYNTVGVNCGGHNVCNTEWAVGNISQWNTLIYSANWNRQGMVGPPLVCHIIDANIYLQITFTGWVDFCQGGDFSYTRTTFGCDANAEINLQGNTTDIVSGSTSTSSGNNTAFGTVNVGSNVTQTFTIQNVGTASLDITGTSVTGTNASEFVITSAPSSSVSASGSTTFNVTFSPTVGGTRTATIHISNRDCDEGDYNFSIAGTGNCTVATTVGTYANTSVIAGQSIFITPSAAPTNNLKMVANTSSNFAGILSVNPTTGVLNVTDARQAGTYTISVSAMGCTTASTTFTLTVTNPNCSQGLFTAAANVTSAGNPSNMAMGDFNNDGKLDILTTDLAGAGKTVVLNLGNGNGTFGSPSVITIPLVNPGPRGMAVADYNGDGNQDFAVANHNQWPLTVAIGNGAGGFSVTNYPSWGAFVYGMETADLNGDGKMDLVCSTGIVLLGNGDGTFTQSANLNVLNCLSVAIADYNGDGIPDVALPRSDGGTQVVLVYQGVGNGAFTLVNTLSVPNVDPWDIKSGDFNNDGKMDFAVINNSGLSVAIGNGAFGFTVSTNSTFSFGSVGMAIADVNGDGNLDIITDANGTGINVYIGNGTGAYSGSPTFYNVSTSTPFRVMVGDFNADGLQDLATCGSGTTAILLGSNAHALSSSSSINCGTVATTLSVTSGALTSPANWYWYTGSCGGTAIGTGTSVSVSPSVTTTYYARGEGGCLGAGGSCASITITVSSAPTAMSAGSNVNICSGGSTTLTATGTGVNSYTWAPMPPTLVLDAVSSSTLAVGLRKLKSSYSGFALQLRRSSDNATQDFGFVGNNLDVAAIATFLGGNSGFCTILYDQSGSGNNMTQTNNSFQPQYVASGINGKPMLHFSSSMRLFNNTNFPAPFTVVYGARQNSASRERVLSSTGNNWLLGWWGGNKQAAYFEGWVSTVAAADNNIYIYSGSGNGSSSQFYENGTLLANNSAGIQGPNGIEMNGWQNSSEFSDCDFLDVVIFSTSLSDNDRAVVENNIGSYYNVATTGTGVVNSPSITVSPTTTTTYTVTGTNTCGSSTATVTVSVGAPTFNACPGNQTANTASETCEANVSYTATATGGSPTYSYALTGATTASGSGTGNGSSFSKGVTTVIITATNSCGSQTCSFTVTVSDMLAPTITCPATATVAANNVGCTYNGSIGTATATDNCGSVNVTGPVPAGPYSLGNTNVTWTATDASGNTATCNQLVTVNTTQPSVSGIGGAFTKTCIANTAGATIGETPVSGFSYSWSPTTDLSATNIGDPTANPSATTIYTVTKTDDVNGCSNTATVAVTVNTTPPSVSGIGGAFTKTCIANTSGATIGETPVSGFSYSWNPATGLSAANVGNPTANPSATTIYTITKTDDVNGCSNTATVAVTVNTTLPSVSGIGGAFTKTCIANTAGATIGETPVSGFSYSWSPATGLSAANIGNPTANPSATTIYTVTKTDDVNGCSNTATVAVTVNTTAPTVTAAASLSTICSGASSTLTGSGADTYSWMPGSLTGTTVSVSPGATTIYTVTGTTTANGCASTGTVTVTVNTAPAFSLCPGNQAANTASNSCDAVVTYTSSSTGTPAPAITYSFSGATTSSGTGDGSGSTFNKGTTTVTLTATNTCANATCSFNVVVADLTPPTITCSGPVTINVTPGICTGITPLTAPTVSDNCASSGNALAISGNANSYVSIPNAPSLNFGGTSNITLETWIYLTAATGGGIITKGTGNGGEQYCLDLGSSFPNAARFFFRQGGTAYVVQGTAIIPANTWTHIAATYDGSDMKMYINGVLNATTSAPGRTFTSNSHLLSLGAREQTNNGNYNLATPCKIDEVRIWKVARTQAQIQANMNNELNAQSGLAAVYHFNQGTAGGNNAGIITATDASGNSNNGTLQNFTLTGSTSNWVGGNVSSGIVITNNAPATYPIGNTTVIWTATDAAGNSATCNQLVTVIDNQAPLLETPLVLLSEDFESGGLAPGWTATGLWHITNSCSGGSPVNPSKWAYFGTDATCNFNNGTVTGSLTSPIISIPASANSATISFWKRYNGEGNPTESTFDLARFRINGVDQTVVINGTSYPANGLQNGLDNQWQRVTVNASAFIGQNVTLSWFFNSVDGTGNSDLGLQIDSFRLVVPNNMIVLPAITNTCAANYTIADPITDNCSGSTWGYSTTGATILTSSGNTIADGTGSGVLSFNKGVTTVTLTGTDGTNAASPIIFTVTVNDNQAPTITTCAIARTVTGCSTAAITDYSTVSAGSSEAQLEDVTNGGDASDACGITSVSYIDVASGTCPIVVTRTWTIADAAGNSSTCDQTINIVAPAVSITQAVNETHLSCEFANQLAAQTAFNTWLATASVSGGCTPTSIPDITTAPAYCGGSVLVTWTITANCYTTSTYSATFAITAAATLTASGTQTNVLCKGNNTGAIALTVNGGCSPKFVWSGGITTQNRTALYAGSYTVTVYDNCQSLILSFTVTEPISGIILTSTSIKPKCFGGATGSATVVASGGSGAYTYSWNTSPIKTTATATGLAAGVYVVTVSSGTCYRNQTIILTNPPALSVNTTLVTNPTNALPNGGAITVAASGGTPNYLYLWYTSPIKTTAAITGLPAGNYTVKVTDKNSCTATKLVQLVQVAKLMSSQQQQSQLAVDVMPNPSDGLFNIRAIAVAEDNATVELLDVTGRILITEQMPLIAGTNSMMLDARSFPKGVYLLRFTVGDTIKTMRLVID